MNNKTFTAIFFLNIFLIANLSAQTVDKPLRPEGKKDPDGETLIIQGRDQNAGSWNGGLKSAEVDFGTAPSWNWVESFSGSGSDWTQDVATDSEGNVYLAGYFSGTVTITQKNLVSAGDKDAYVAKFDRLGKLVWINQIESVPGSRIYLWELTIGPDNSVYVAGGYKGNVTIGGMAMSNARDYSMFMAKLDGSGQLVMVRENGTSDDNELGFDIDLDDLGNIFVLATQGANVDNKAAPSILVKYNPAGDILWERLFDERISALDVANSSLFITGSLQSTYGERTGFMDGILDTNVTLLHPYGYEDAFVAKADLDGVFQWGTMVEHLDSTIGDSYSDHIYADDNGNVYFSGRFRDEITLGMFNNVYAQSGQDTYLARANPDGRILWGINYFEVNEGIQPDVDGSILVSEGPNLVTVDTMFGDFYPRTQLEYAPRAFATFIDTGNTIVNARYAAGLRNGNMVISKNDVNFSAAWLVEFTGNSGSGDVYGIATDDIGYFYVYGKASGKLDYFGKILSNCSFLSKHSISGDLIWIKEFPGLFLNIGNEIPIAIDKDFKNLYITGRYTGDFDLAGDASLFTAQDQYEFFVAKYSTSGEFEWVYEGYFDPQELAVAPDNSGNVLLSGIYSDHINIGGIPITHQGGDDAFLTKLNSTGEPVWAFGLGGDNIEYMCYVATDASDNIYLAGEFLSENLTVGSTQHVMAEGDGNVFVSKLDKDGNVIWIKTKAGSPVPGNDYSSWPTGLVTDPAGNVFIKGWHGDSAYFDSHLLRSTHGPYSYYNAKLDTDGNTVWVNSINEKQYGFDYNLFDVDDAGNVYLGAQARDTLWFGSDFTYTEVQQGDYDLFVAQYKANGDLGWVKTIGGDRNYSNMRSVAVMDADRIFVGGYIGSTAEFDDITISSSNRSGFIAMLTSASKPKITYIKKDVTVNGGNNGSIDVSISGGLPPFTYAWSNGAVTEDITKLFAGEYRITVSDAAGGTNYQVIMIDEPEDTVCNISARFRLSAADLSLETENNSSGLNNSYSWSFGDGFQSNEFQPVRTYDKPGSYEVCLTVFDSLTNCFDEVCQVIEVGQVVCAADFEFYYDTTVANKIVYTSTSTGPLYSYMWLFGDGNVSTEENPTHIYQQNGYYDVSLIVVDRNGNCMDQATASILAGTAECNADFSYYIDAASGTAHFSSKDPNDGSIYYWLFGDGSTSTIKVPVHKYTYPGFYKISLSVYDELSGCIDEKSKIVLVGSGGDVEADFIYQTQETGTNVSFQDQSLGDDMSYFWDFGDGTNSVKQNPIHDFVVDGYYNVCLNVYGANGLQNITCKRVFVGQDASTECLADFTLLVDNDSRTVIYSDISFGNPDLYVWDFGDDNTSDVKDPEHTYQDAGYYLVQHMVENTANNCKDYAFKLVNVDSEERLVAGFGFLIDSTNKKADTYPVDFIGVSLGDAGKLKWDFGDGNIDTTSLSPQHNYSQPGTYTVCLYLSDPNTGQSDTTCQVITVSTRGTVGLGSVGESVINLSSYPNPFNDYSTVVFELNDPAFVDLALYDMMGRKVKQLVRDKSEAGKHQLELKGSEFEGGHYYLLLRTSDSVQRKVITILR